MPFVVKWFNRTKGFGFLENPNVAEDVFAHMENVRRAGLAELRPGQHVEARYGRTSKGLAVAALRPAS
jgi:CspA family cold shock protein